MKLLVHHTARSIHLLSLVITVVVTVGLVGASARAETNDVATERSIASAEQSNLRDPFWPIGYRLEEPLTVAPGKASTKSVVESGKADWSQAMKLILISGVSSRAGNEFFAVVNGQIKSVGDTVSVSMGGRIYTWKIYEISPPSSVKLRRISVQ
jgi:hypothetical protein